MSLDRNSVPGQLRNAAGLGWTEDAPTRRLLAADWRLDYADFDASLEKPRSVIFFGGPIITVDDQLPEVEAMAIKDGKIVALGDRKKVFESHTARTRMIDLEGRALMPGFIDPHVHLAWTAATRYRWLNVSPLATPRRQQMLDAIGEVASNKTAGEWVLAFGYDPSRSAPGEMPLTAEELDKASMANPIFVMAQSSEVAYVNHRGLDMVSTRMPEANGSGHELTGELVGAASFAPFFETFPPFTFEQKLRDCTRLAREWAGKGCTTVYDAGVGALWGQEEVRLILDLASDPATPLRLRAALVPANNLPRVAGIRPGQGNDRLSFVGIEFTADGLEPGQRALAEPLLTKIEGKSLNHDDDDLKTRMQPWHDANWQLLVHVSRHEAVDQVLRVFESIFADSPRIKHRHRLDGCEAIDERQLARARHLGLSISHLIGFAGL
ncbi:MAG TPA: amidohydrolase family protein, partial [Blastocatellia bacterium]|nr:amidohydrolase family protein [Blastocatellia bacterium]